MTDRRKHLPPNNAESLDDVVFEIVRKYRDYVWLVRAPFEQEHQYYASIRRKGERGKWHSALNSAGEKMLVGRFENGGNARSDTPAKALRGAIENMLKRRQEIFDGLVTPD